MHVRALILHGAALLIVACQTTVYQVERTRTYARDKQATWDDLLAFLERNQIRMTDADFASGRVEAERRDFEDQGWADCERARAYRESGSGGSQMNWALRVDRELVLRLAVTENAGTTEVTVDARFAEEQINPWSYRRFMQPCRSTGVLEGALLDALRGPVAAGPANDQRTR